MNNLSNMKKDYPFKVPEDYFEKLSDRVAERIELEDKPRGKRLFEVVKPYLWMAASVIGLVFIVKVILTNSVPSDYRNPQLTQIEDTNAINIASRNDTNVFFDNLSEITSDEIIEYLSDYDIETDALLANL